MGKMEYKKTKIFLMIAIFLFSIATVSAGDVNDTVIAIEDTSQNDLSAGNEISEDNLKASEENTALSQMDNDEIVSAEPGSEILGEGEGNYTDLKNDIINNGGSLTKSIYRYCDGDGDTIEITTPNMVINGNGAVIDMKESTRAFYVSASGVTIKNLTIKNANYDGDGGAIYFSSSATSGTVTNCNFINNSASYGGAVYFQSTGNVTNCNFINNSASYGGAVYFWNQGNVSNCNFTGNNATGDGGAVHFWGQGTVTNCNFTNNTATSQGGAIRFVSTGTVTNCNFVNNTASEWGGAIRFSGTGTVTNCNFTDNTASGDGGAVYFWNQGTVSNCNFTNNKASVDGGAVYFLDQGTVSNCNFTNNTAGDWGGAVYFSRTGNVTNCNFTNNSATVNGGAVFFRLTSNVTNCNFTDNTAITGSAIYFYKYYSSDTLTVSDSTFLNNRANAEALNVVKNDNNITITFTGRNNLLNAIYSREDAEVTFTNVTYWGAKGITTVSATMSRSNKAAGQNITVGVVVNNELVLSDVMVTNESGMIVLDISAGENYYISARHDTDSYYTEAERTISNNTKFNVNVTSQTTNNKTVNITAKSNIYSEFMPGKLLFILPNGTQINATYGANGIWWAVHTFDAYGEYKVNATYVGLDNVTVNNATITVNKIKTELSGNAITTTYNINKDLIITLKDSNGNPVSGAKLIVDLNGAKTYTTDSNGQVKVSTKGLAPNVYTAKVTFNGNTNYAKSTKNVKVTVKKATPKLTAKKKTFKTTTKTKKYTIILKDNTGKAIKKAKVTLKVKGKTYKATTNSKGKAVFKITKLNKKGTFKATITYKGNKYYNKVSKKANIKVIVTFKTVSKGSKDKSTVKEIQQALKDHGYYLSYKGHYLKVDGKFQSCTERSVKQFQKDKGLKVTGKVDEKTAKKLGII